MTDDLVTIRPAGLADVTVLVRHRRRMFEDMGLDDPAALDEMEVAFADWVTRKLELGEYKGWLACEANGAVVAGVGLWLREWSPMPSDLSNQRGRVMDVYTAPAHRRRGLSRRLMNVLMEWCRAQGVRSLDLNASEQGQGLYESLGFQSLNEMRLILGS